MAITNFNHRVDWIEFTERISRAAGVDENAKIKLDMGYSYDMTKSDGEWTVTNLKVELAVKKAESWIVKGTKTEKLRNHEQGHYDITALGYRDMYNEVKVLKRKSMSALKAKIKKGTTQIQEILLLLLLILTMVGIKVTLIV